MLKYTSLHFFLLLNFQQKVFISSVLFGLHISFRDCPVQIYVYSMHRRHSTFFYYNLHSSIWAAMIEGRIYFCCRNITNYNCLYQRWRKFKNLGEANSNRLSLSCLCSLFYSVKIREGHGTLALCFRHPCSSFPRNLIVSVTLTKR